ncbi:MBL fold metallo-hydrolase [Kribbella sp. NPDC058245]|uniref:MBL fold metallo-hydrolase n=1 Tax=Kribbella sp. NPDC058245 TaxID=3346399 RepID=UPI0036E8AC33
MTAALRRPATRRSLDLGDLRVTYIPDGAVQLVPDRWFPTTTAATWSEHSQYVDASGHLVASIGGLLIESGDRALLIDAGFGPQTWPAAPDAPIGVVQGGTLLDNLGRDPRDIEAVAFTHLHVDHVGWASAFPAATYLIAEPEWAERHHAVANGIDQQTLDTLQDRTKTVADGNEIFPGVTVSLFPGHTAGHAAYVVQSGSQRLIAFGDAMHSSLQVTHPEWWAAPDHDREQAMTQRRRLIDELRQPGTIGFGIHFADVQFGRVAAESTWEAL